MSPSPRAMVWVPSGSGVVSFVIGPISLSRLHDMREFRPILYTVFRICSDASGKGLEWEIGRRWWWSAPESPGS